MEPSFELDLTWGANIKELDLVKKKKKTLDELLATKQISKATYEYLDKKLVEETDNLETKLKSLSDSMTARAQELERQIAGLEIFLANLEMYHATGEIDDNTYGSQNKTIVLRLEVTKQELKNVKDSLLKTVSGAFETIKSASKPDTVAEEHVIERGNENQDVTEIETENGDETVSSAQLTEDATQGTLETSDPESTAMTVEPTESNQEVTIENVSN